MEPITLLALLNSYIFSGVLGNAAYDTVKRAWEHIPHKDWENLYLEAFLEATEESEQHLLRYTDGDIVLDESILKRVLHQNMAVDINSQTLSEISETQFIERLSTALAEAEALSLSGHTLNKEDYTQILRNLAQSATRRFKQTILQHDSSFHDALYREVNGNQQILQSILVVLDKRFEIQITQLNRIEDAIRDLPTLVSERVVRDITSTFSQTQPLSPSIQTQLPHLPLTHLVGRESEAEWLNSHLRDPSTPIIGLIGMAGIGKTALTLSSVQRLQSEGVFQNLIWLRGAGYNILGIQAQLAVALGVPLQAEDIVLRASLIARAFQGRPTSLVVLDDVRQAHLEHFDLLVPPSPPCKLLVISRRYDLPLSLNTVLRLEELSSSRAEALLATHIPSTILGEEPEALQESLELLGGNPLALFLAARRINNFLQRRLPVVHPLATLVNELKAKRLEVLSPGNQPDLSVHLTFQASYEDLDEGDQLRFAMLGVFSQHEFDQAALQVVWEADDHSVSKSLRQLSNAGLLFESADDRWWMHELLWEYAADKLLRTTQEIQVASRLAHAIYWYNQANVVRPRSVAEWRKVQKILPEAEQAVRWLLPHWNLAPPLAASLMVAVLRFASWLNISLKECIQYGIDAAQSIENLSLLAQLQRGMGRLHLYQGELKLAQHWLDQSLNLSTVAYQNASGEAEQQDSQHTLTLTESLLAAVLRQQGKLTEAGNYYLNSQKSFKALQDPYSEAGVLIDWGMMLIEQGHYDEAESRFEAGLLLAKSTQDTALETKCQLAKRQLPKYRELPDAEDFHREAIDFFETIGDRHTVALAYRWLADFYNSSQEFKKAEDHYRDAIAIFQQLQGYELAITERDLAHILMAQGNFEEARRFYGNASEHISDPTQVPLLQVFAAVAQALQGEQEPATVAYKAALGELTSLGRTLDMAIAEGHWAEVLQSEGKHEEAERLYRRSMTTFWELDERPSLSAVQGKLASLLMKGGRYAEAETLYVQSINHCEKLGLHYQAVLYKIELMETYDLYTQALWYKQKYSDAIAQCEAGLSVAHSIANAAYVQQFSDDLAQMRRALRQ